MARGGRKVIKTAKGLLYGPRSQGREPSNWREEDLTELRRCIEEEADTQRTERAVKLLCSEMEISQAEFYELDEFKASSLIKLRQEKEDFGQNDALLDVEFDEDDGLRICLTPQGSYEALVITKAYRRVEKTDKCKAWLLSGHMETQNQKLARFTDQTFKQLHDNIDPDSVLLRILAITRNIDELIYYE